MPAIPGPKDLVPDQGSFAAVPPEPELRQAGARPFRELGLNDPLLKALAEQGYATPTPVQREAIPTILSGADLVGCAQTGTGKTAAFVLPLLQRLGARSGVPRALILTPTRELAAQIGERTRAYAKYLELGHVVIYGGVNQKRQERELRTSPDILIATPGRLLDLIQQGLLSLAGIELLVLDEADTMLDMGFIHDIRRVVRQLPTERQTLLFSATMPPSIAALIRSITRQAKRVAVDPVSTAAERIQQSVFMVERSDKRRLLEGILRGEAQHRVLVFTRTKHAANRLAQQLARAGVGSAAIHGNKSQSARETALGRFKTGVAPVLVATDVAARGIDVAGVELVVNFDLPNVPESYVHRIGRTGRAGAVGRAMSFCAPEDKPLLKDIERLLKRSIDVVESQLPTRARAERGAGAASMALPRVKTPALAGGKPGKAATRSEQTGRGSGKLPPGGGPARGRRRRSRPRAAYAASARG